MNAAAGRDETWLRGNVRPAVGLVLAAAAITVAGVALAWAGGAPAASVGLLAAAGGVVLASAAAVAVAAARPRLALHGAAVRIRLAPLVAHDVPLDMVECVFLGSRPLAAAAAGAAPGTTGGDAAEAEASRRVATLVMRIAERATAWQSRPTFRAWGTWEEGNVVFDGRWCEPLTVVLARDVARRLLEAKRAGAAAAAPAPGTEP